MTRIFQQPAVTGALSCQLNCHVLAPAVGCGFAAVKYWKLLLPGVSRFVNTGPDSVPPEQLAAVDVVFVKTTFNIDCTHDDSITWPDAFVYCHTTGNELPRL